MNLDLDGKALSGLLDALYQRVSHGIKPGLENTRRLFECLKIPLDKLPVVHLAGTNGKGSTAAMLESILHHSGYKTGLFTSPHLVKFNERYRLNGTAIDDQILLRSIQKVMGVVVQDDEDLPDSPITFFECSTAIALLIFMEADVDVAIIETGLGGRLDATNVLTPILSVITRIEFDHMQYLGGTLPEIAYEKAGIIKKNIPVVLSSQYDDAHQVLLAQAQALNSPVYETDEIQITELKREIQPLLNVSSSADDYGRIQFPLAGRFQYENLSTVMTAVEVLQGVGWSQITRKSIKEGLNSTRWPGRMEVVNQNPFTLLDCAHNVSGVKAFLETIQLHKSKKQPLGFIFGCSSDKDAGAMLGEIAKVANHIWLVEFTSSRSASLSVLSETLQDLNTDIPFKQGGLSSMMKDAGQWAVSNHAQLAVGGSIFLVGEWKAMFQ